MANKRSRQILTVVFLVLLAYFWFGGAAGRLMVVCCDKFVFPFDTGVNASFQTIGYGLPEKLPEERVELRISSARLDMIASGALGWKRRLIPPGLISDGLMIAGSWQEYVSESNSISIPVYFIIDDREIRPVLKARLPVDGLNQLLMGTDLLGRRVKRRKWALGHYEVASRKTFEFMKLYSLPVVPGGAVDRREAVAEGAGWIRYTMEENLVDARTTVRISKIAIKVVVDVLHYHDGAGIDFVVSVTDLRGDFNNVAPSLDRQLVEKFRESIESSLNSRKNHNKIAKKRIPDWVPLDVDFMLEFAQ